MTQDKNSQQPQTPEGDKGGWHVFTKAYLPEHFENAIVVEVGSTLRPLQGNTFQLYEPNGSPVTAYFYKDFLNKGYTQPFKDEGDKVEGKQAMEDIINERADQLERIGFVFKVSENSVWYEKGDVKMNSVLMAAAPTIDWNKFISENKDASIGMTPASSGEEKRFTLKEMLECFEAGEQRGNDYISGYGYSHNNNDEVAYFKDKFGIDI